MASLCLALQLSDEVLRASGAMRMDSLFIDEGFGTLDTDSLSEVTDALEALREDGDRLIGIISCVDTRIRLPARRTVFVPAGVPHTYREVVPSRYLIILTPRLAQLITELHSLVDPSQLTETLAKYETSLVERRNPRSGR
jgi:hypothetical protein